jgi:WD40 repeat protein
VINLFGHTCSLLVFLMIFYFLSVSMISAKAQSSVMPLAELDDQQRRIQTVAWEPITGSMLAVAADYSIGIYTEDLKEIIRLDGHSDMVSNLAWSPDGTLLASASLDQTIRIWDVQVNSVAFGQAIKILQGFTDWVLDVSWSPSGDKLASSVVVRASVDTGQLINEVDVWDVSDIVNAKIVLELPRLANLAAITWSPDGIYLAYAGDDGNIVNYHGVVYETVSGELVTTLPSFGTSLIFSNRWNPVANVLAMTAEEFQEIYLFNPLSGQLLTTLSGQQAITGAVAWSPDGSQLSSASLDDSIQIWDVGTAQTLSVIQDTSQVYQTDWSPDGSKLASLNAENIVRIWDVSGLEAPANVPTATFFRTTTLTPQPR